MIPETEIAKMKERVEKATAEEDALVPGDGRTSLTFSPAGIYPVTDNDGTKMESCEAGVWYDDGDICAEVHGNLGLGMDGDSFAEFFAHARADIPALLSERSELLSKIEEQERELVRLREGWVSDMWWDAYDPDRPHYSAREAVVAHYGTNEIVEFQCAKRMPTMFGYITDATEDADEDAKLFDTLAEAEAALKMEKQGVPVVDVPKINP